MGAMIKTSDKETKVFIDEYQGKQMFAVWPVDPAGNKVGSFPHVSFGLKKAQAILKHLEELQEYVEITK